MIGKVVHGKSFRGCVLYCMEKEHAEVLDCYGVRMESAEMAIRDFNRVKSLNTRLEKAVWHTAISFAPEDTIDNELMVKVARDYIEKIGLGNSQYLVIRHKDTSHQHLHIVANRITLQGDTVSDRFSMNRSASICDELELKYNLTVARGHGQGRKKDKVPVLQKAKKDIRIVMAKGLDQGINSWQHLERYLKSKDVELQFQKQSTGRINGISFRMGEISVKGSAVDRAFSYQRLDKRFNAKKSIELGL